MATYKLIQDIEAEDHILGPLTLRQFIYALVAAFLYYMSFLVVTKGIAFLLLVFVPPALFCTFFAFPFGKDQSTEIWALAKLRFLLKPRKRIWDQSGVKELVTITVPKKIEHALTDGLDQTEVKSRLQALANTLDSRGWAVKNVNVNAFAYPDPFMNQSSDRLIDASSIPQEVSNTDVNAADDILDEANNPVAQSFQHMIVESAHQHRQQLMNHMNDSSQPAPGSQAQPQASGPADYWFMSQPLKGSLPADQTTFASNQRVTPGAQTNDTFLGHSDTPEEKALAARLKAQHDQPQASYGHMRTLRPLGDNSAPQPGNDDAQNQPKKPGKAPADPAILSLASNNDLNVATLARQAEKAKKEEEPPQDEVVISLR